MAGDMEEFPGADALDDEALGILGAHVRPDDGIRQRRARLVHAQTAHHLAAEGHGEHVRGIDGGEQVAARIAHGLPPVLRVLFGPVAVVVAGGIGAGRAADQFTLGGEQRRLVAGGAQVVGEQVFWHPIISLRKSGGKSG